jgi:hypothetical protein
MAGNVTDNCHANPILHKLLKDFASDSGFQMEEFFIEARNGDHNERYILAYDVANQLDCIVISSQLLAIRCAHEDAQSVHHLAVAIHFRNRSRTKAGPSPSSRNNSGLGSG